VGEAVVRIGDTRNVYKILVDEPLGKRLRRTPTSNGKITLILECGRWIELAQDRVQWQALVLAVLNLRVLLPELVN